MLTDYHLHNHLSPDSETDTRELIQKEKELGVSAICITNHTEWFVEGEGISGSFDPTEAIPRFKRTESELNELRSEFPDIQIGFGAEVQYQEKHMSDLKDFISETPFDFVLGSVHGIDGVQISGGKHAGDLYKVTDEETAYTHYFEAMIKLIEWGHIDAVAHFDICKKYGHESYGPFQPEKYKPIILKILQLMKEKGIGMELNTGSLHKRCKELFPHPDILKWCVEIGIEHYTLGSDAHGLKEAGRYLDEALAIAKEAGIKTLSTYKKRMPTKHDL